MERDSALAEKFSAFREDFRKNRGYPHTTLFFGFFLFITWTHFNFSSPLMTASSQPVEFAALAYESSLVFNSITLLVCALFHRAVERGLFSPFVTIGSAFFCVVGTLLACLPMESVVSSAARVVTGSLFTGIGSPLFFSSCWEPSSQGITSICSPFSLPYSRRTWPFPF